MNGFDIQIEYSKRLKRSKLEVCPGNIIKFMAPIGTNEEFIHKAIQEKASWIIEKSKTLEGLKGPRVKELISGESFPIAGKDYRLKVIVGLNAEIAINGNNIVATIPNGLDEKERELTLRTLLTSLYKKEAKNLLSERVKFYSNKMGISCTKKILIKEMKNKWGHCSTDGQISFHWKVVSLNLSQMDYIVIHELAHLKHLNHSEDFKNLVSRYTNPEEHRRTLIGADLSF